MAYRITLQWDLFPNDGSSSEDETNEALRIALEALYQRDVDYLRRHPLTPGVYDSGIYYQEEPPGSEDWADVPTILKLGWGDCEDLACWRAAELFVRHGIAAKPEVTCQISADGTRLYHITVALPDGRSEDPSRNLGMR